MPPKKEPPGERLVDASEEKEIVEKELVISYLKSKLGRYQEQGEKLQVSNFKLLEELDKQKLNLRDINEFLTNELKARSLTTTAMEERVAELTQQMQDLRRECEAEVARVRAERARDAEAMGASMTELQHKMALSQEFLDRRDTLEGELAAAKAQLEKQLWDHKAHVSNMERLHLQEKEKWRREMAAKIKETKVQMAQLADTHLEQSTKRTIVENESLSSELEFHKATTTQLMGHSLVMRGDMSELSRQAQVAEALADSMARKNLLLQRTLNAVLAHFRQYKAGATLHNGQQQQQQQQQRTGDGLASAGPSGRHTGFSEGGASSSGGAAGVPGRSVLGEEVQMAEQVPFDGLQLAEGRFPEQQGAGRGSGAGRDPQVAGFEAGSGCEAGQQCVGADDGVPTLGAGFSGGVSVEDEMDALRELVLELEAQLAISEQRREAASPSASVSAALHEGVTGFVLLCVGQLRAKPLPVGSLPPWNRGPGRNSAAAVAATAVLDAVPHHVREQLAQYLLDQLHVYPGAKQLAAAAATAANAEGRMRGLSATAGAARKSGVYGGAGLVLPRSASALGHSHDRESGVQWERSAAASAYMYGNESVSPSGASAATAGGGFRASRHAAGLAALLPSHLQADVAEALQSSSSPSGNVAQSSLAAATGGSRSTSPWADTPTWAPVGGQPGGHLGGPAGVSLGGPGASPRAAALSPMASSSVASPLVGHSPRLPALSKINNSTNDDASAAETSTVTGHTTEDLVAGPRRTAEDLMLAVLSDVRPWGRPAVEQPTSPGFTTAQFLRKGTGTGAAAAGAAAVMAGSGGAGAIGVGVGAPGPPSPLSPQRQREVLGQSLRVSFQGATASPRK